MPAPTTPETERLREILSGLRRRWRWAEFGRGVGRCVVYGGAVLTIALLADRFFFLETWMRLGLTTVAVAVTGGLAFNALRQWWRPCSDLALAHRLEAERPELDEAVLSAVEVTHASPAVLPAASLVRVLGREALARLEGVPVQQRLDFSAHRRWVFGALVMVALFAVMAFSDPTGWRQLLARFSAPTMELPRPTRVSIRVLPGDTVCGTGRDVDLSVVLERGDAAEAVFLYRRHADAEWRAAYAALGGDRTARFAIADVRGEVRYRVYAGDARSPIYTIHCRPPPHPVAAVRIVRLPSYTGIPPETVREPFGDFTVLRGSRVEWQIETSEPLAAARLEMRPLSAGSEASAWETFPVRVGERQLVVIDWAPVTDHRVRLYLQGRRWSRQQP